MATLNLPNVRIASDVRFKVKLTDNSVAVDWTSLTGIRAFAYSDAQRIMAGELQASIDPTDSETLIVNYEDTVPQYQGIVRLVIRGDYDGRQKTFDKPVINFVEFTAQATGVTVITDPVVDVTLAVTEVSTSLLDEAIDACIAATALAEEAATHGPKIDQNNKHWLVWDAEEGEYVDTGIVAEGSAGTTNFNNLTNRPKYNGSQMTGQTNIPTVPTKTSDLTNDSGFLTQHQSLAAYRTSAAQDIIDATKASATDVDAIEAKIPAQATAQNQLADKNFVNSSIATNTATFKGTYDATDNGWTKIIYKKNFNQWNHGQFAVNLNIGLITWESVSGGKKVTVKDVEGNTVLQHTFEYEESANQYKAFTYIGPSIDNIDARVHFYDDGVGSSCWEIEINGGDYINEIEGEAFELPDGINYQAIDGLTAYDNNDYMNFIVTEGNDRIYKRYKYGGSGWMYEWDINTSNYTAAQWAAINSGITSSLVTAFGAKYNKPASGIPASDLASGVIPDVSGFASKVASATNGNFAGLDSNGNLTDSGKKASDFASPVSQIAVANSVASQELAPNTLYVFATRSSNLALTFGTAISGIANEYNFIITIDSTTLPTISGLSSITWNGGSAPSFSLGKKYEVSIQEGVGIYIEI